RRRRVAFGGLEDETIAAGDGQRIHPHRHHSREVERRYTGDDAERLTVGVGIDRWADIAAELALEELRNTAGKIDAVDAARQLAHRVVMHLAVLARDFSRQLVGMFFEQFLELEHHPRTLHRR